MVRVPPGSSTFTTGADMPSDWATAAAAQAPVPQARVQPLPRSCTRRRMRSNPRRWAKPVDARIGKVVVEDDRMRIAHRDGTEGDPFADDFQGVRRGLCGCVER